MAIYEWIDFTSAECAIAASHITLCNIFHAFVKSEVEIWMIYAVAGPHFGYSHCHSALTRRVHSLEGLAKHDAG